jgi:hypothetical protein
MSISKCDIVELAARESDTVFARLAAAVARAETAERRVVELEAAIHAALNGIDVNTPKAVRAYLTLSAVMGDGR